MKVELTKEEMNLIQQLLVQSNLTMNKESMVNYINMCDAILKKFIEAEQECLAKST